MQEKRLHIVSSALEIVVTPFWQRVYDVMYKVT